MSALSGAEIAASKDLLLGMTSLELSKLAEPFLQMFEESRHFSLALGVLLPTMNDAECNTALRIQATFLLWYLYRKHSLDMNPFTGAFRETLQTEQNKGRKADRQSGGFFASGYATTGPGGEYALMLVLEVVLTGRGYELERHSPDELINHWPLTMERTPRTTLKSVKEEEKMDDVDLARRILLYASETTLSLMEQRTLTRILPSLPIPLPSTSTDPDPSFPLHILDLIITNNPGNTTYSLLTNVISRSTDEGRQCCWDVLRNLQPTLANFDLITRLLKDGTLVRPLDKSNGDSSSGVGSDTVGSMVRRHALNAFIEHCGMVIEYMEAEESGLDGRVAELDPSGVCAIALQNFCRFCLTLLRSGNGMAGVVWGHEMEEDEWFGMTTVMRSFALRYVRFEIGSELYGVLARQSMGRGG